MPHQASHAQRAGLQDVVTRGGKFFFLYKRPGHRVILTDGGHMMVSPSSMEASLHASLAGVGLCVRACECVCVRVQPCIWCAPLLGMHAALCDATASKVALLEGQHHFMWHRLKGESSPGHKLLMGCRSKHG